MITQLIEMSRATVFVGMRVRKYGNHNLAAIDGA